MEESWKATIRRIVIIKMNSLRYGNPKDYAVIISLEDFIEMLPSESIDYILPYRERVEYLDKCIETYYRLP